MIRLRWNPAVELEWRGANEAYNLYVRAGMIPFVSGARAQTFDPVWGEVEFRFRSTGLERVAGSELFEEDSDG